MDRPSRKTKAVNYCESKGFDDDEDFAAPPSKKSKEEQNHWSSKSVLPEGGWRSSQSQSSRKPPDEKQLQRDLEAAITLSMLNDGAEPQTDAGRGTEVEPPGEKSRPSSLLRSNCSVDGDVLDLDKITSESQTKKQNKAEEWKRKDEDDDYKPKLTPGSESDEDFSEADESDEVEITVKKTSKAKKTKKEKPRSTPAAPKAKRPSKPSASKAAVSPVTIKPPTAKPPPSRAVAAAVSGSPAGGRIPRWNPPALAGGTPSSSQRPAARSPGQGLRLGLSRLVRVKPLHPGVASH